MRDIKQCEQEVLAAADKLSLSKLNGRNDLVRAISNALVPQFEDRYPYHKTLTEIVLKHVYEKYESMEEIISRIQGHSGLLPFQICLKSFSNDPFSRL